MYAIIRTGGNQYRVKQNDEIEVEKLNIPEGEDFEIEEVLAIGNDDDISVGFPYLMNAKVEAELVEQGIGDEVIVFKYKPKKKYRKKNIHKQPFSRIKIKSIELLNYSNTDVEETITTETEHFNESQVEVVDTDNNSTEEEWDFFYKCERT